MVQFGPGLCEVIAIGQRCDRAWSLGAGVPKEGVQDEEREGEAGR
jgi:hypothetical protein